MEGHADKAAHSRDLTAAVQGTGVGAGLAIRNQRPEAQVLEQAARARLGVGVGVGVGLAIQHQRLEAQVLEQAARPRSLYHHLRRQLRDDRRAMGFARRTVSNYC